MQLLTSSVTGLPVSGSTCSVAPSRIKIFIFV